MSRHLHCRFVCFLRRPSAGRPGSEPGFLLVAGQGVEPRSEVYGASWESVPDHPAAFSVRDLMFIKSYTGCSVSVKQNLSGFLLTGSGARCTVWLAMRIHDTKSALPSENLRGFPLDALPPAVGPFFTEHGRRGKARPGVAGRGMARLGKAGEAGRGTVGQGVARRGRAGQGRRGMARQGGAWQGRARRGAARQGRRGRKEVQHHK